MERNIKYKYSEITEKIIGLAMKVHSAMGSGFQEIIYQRCLAIEFKQNNIAYIEEFEMPIYYYGYNVGMRRVDFFVEGKICVELKAIINLDDTNLAQALNYLEAQNSEVGLLLNFGAKSLQYKRLLNRKYKKPETVLTSINKN